MTKATDTRPEYVVFIAFRTTVVMRTDSTYIAYLVSLHIHPFTKYHKLWPFTTGSCDGRRTLLAASCEDRGYKGRIRNDELKQNFPSLKRWRRRRRRRKNNSKKKRKKKTSKR